MYKFGYHVRSLAEMATIMIVGLLVYEFLFSGIPAAPIPGNFTFTDNALTFSWSSSSNSVCFSNYSVNVTDGISFIVHTTTNTNLSLPIPPASFNDTEYSISVVTVDTGGRYMNPQGMERYIADGKCYG